MTAAAQAPPSKEQDTVVMEEDATETKKPLEESKDVSENKEETADEKTTLPATQQDKNETPEKPPPPRPIKKARTAYFLFADSKRAELQAAHPGESVGVIARFTGQAWAKLSDEDRATFQEQAAQERARVAKELEEYKAKYGDYQEPTQQQQSDMIMPVARIRKICKLDPEVKGMSKEAIMLITKCTEMALVKLGEESVRVANLQNRRKLLPEDVAQVCSSREQFLFLREDVRDLIREQTEEHKLQKQHAKKQVQPPPSTNSKPLTAYFGTTNKE